MKEFKILKFIVNLLDLLKENLYICREIELQMPNFGL